MNREQELAVWERFFAAAVASLTDPAFGLRQKSEQGAQMADHMMRELRQRYRDGLPDPGPRRKRS